MQSSAPPTGWSLNPPNPAERRQIVPLVDTCGSPSVAVVSQPVAGGLGTAPRQAAYTANLEAQVRVLEQEVHLLRTGLEQNERLRHISASTAPPPKRSLSASTKRVHFAPSSTVVPPSPPRPASASSRAATGVDDRPRLVFGQRVSPTHSRIVPQGGPPRAYSLRKQRATSLGNPNPTSARSGSVPPSSRTSCTSTASLRLFPAPASLRGGNTNGIPLQGAATGAIVASPVAGDTHPPAPSLVGASSTSPAAATVWASADPNLPWPRVTTPAAGTLAGASQLSCYPFRTTPTSLPAATPTPMPSEPSVTSGPQLVCAPVETNGAVASPIVVTMSSDKSLPISLAPPTLPTARPATEATPSAAAPLPKPPALSQPAPSSALAATHPLARRTDPSLSVTATATTLGTSAVPPAARSSASEPTTVAQLEAEVLSLRDTLAQREALLHRVLLELHHGCNKGDAHRQGAGTAIAESVEERRQSREALRLLADELLAAQTQLSNVRASHHQVVAELHRCRQQVHQAPPPPQQQAAPPTSTSSPGTPPPSTNPLQKQLSIALQKLKAWEDWYATSTTAPGHKAACVTAGSDGAVASARDASSTQKLMPQSKASNTEDQTGEGATTPAAAASRGGHHKKVSHKRERRAHEATAPIWCPHCGFAVSATSKLKDSGVGDVVPCGFGGPRLASAPLHCASLSLPSTLGLQKLSTAPPPVPYTSAYALDSILFNNLTSQQGVKNLRDNGSAEAEPEAAAKVAGGAATPPPPSRPEDAVAASAAAAAQANETRGKSLHAPLVGMSNARTAHQNVITAPCCASPTWAVPMGGSSTAGVGSLGRYACEKNLSTGLIGGQVASNPYASPYYDGLDHTQQQACSAQQYVTQLAREAAVRELAEAERQVAEQRLLLSKHLHSHTHGLSSTPNGQHSAGVGKQEVVE
ncbi:hypothetical protein JKF63_05827 [Porcisia hertigi]|uniref:Uncharacterized protein n=1 Tax=Porcisia hertigi TaxID=2761500 RepID=A0A836LCF2_9TRYP|nr:hypothetical protein JKF63_05827 [Porcisia hertigi]